MNHKYTLGLYYTEWKIPKCITCQLENHQTLLFLNLGIKSLLKLIRKFYFKKINRHLALFFAKVRFKNILINKIN